MTRISAAVLACLALGASPSSSDHALAALDLGDGQAATARAVALEGWKVGVWVEPMRVGPLVVRVGPVRPASANPFDAWLQHEVVLENRGDRRLTFADTGGFADLISPGRPVLATGDRRCVPTRSRRITFACLAYIDAFWVAPHSSERRTIWLFKDLAGLRRLLPGTYVLRKAIRFRAGRQVPEKGEGREAVLRIVYEIARP